MPNAEQHTSTFAWGSAEGTPPVVSGLSVRKWDFKAEPPVVSEAVDGEGHVEGVAMSKATHRKITGSITGYIPTGTVGVSNAIANSFSFAYNGVTRFFLVTGISEPRNKGEYVEVTVDVRSDALVTS